MCQTTIRALLAATFVNVAIAMPFSSREEAGYDPQLSKQFASLASVAYCSDLSKVTSWTCGACKESNTPLVPGKIRVIDDGAGNATRIIVGKLKDQHGCLMSFRGSSNVLNWVRDFQVWEIAPADYDHCDGCKVHTGFYKIWNNVKDNVMKAITEVGCGQYSVSTEPDNLLYITGHSLGAALTHLAMFTLASRGWNIAKTYSYEAPRVGNKAFAKAFDKAFDSKFPVFRMTHAQDPIVHLPPKSFGYSHVQPEVYIDRKGKYTVCEDAENKTCADQHWDIPTMIALHSGDHCGSPLVANGDICSPQGC